MRVVAVADDPRVGRMRLGPATNCFDHPVERPDAGEVELAAIDPSVQRMRMAVAERRNESAAVELHDPIERHRRRRRLVSDRHDAIAIDGQRRRRRTVERDDGSTGEEHACHHMIRAGTTCRSVCRAVWLHQRRVLSSG